MERQNTVPRERLYRELWAEPARVVAKRYGISDAGLAKVCRRYGIPKPGLGYWAQRQFGKAPESEPLPPAQNPSLDTVVFQAGEQSGAYANSFEYRREKDPEWRIEVPPDLKLAHPLVRQTESALRSAEGPKGERHRLQAPYQAPLLTPGPGCLDIAVSRPLRARALRVLQALVVACEKRGYSVSVANNGVTVVRVLDEPMEIALSERLKQVRVQHRDGEALELQPSGCLRLRVGGSYSSAGITDDPPRLVEDQLNRFMANLVRRALSAKHERAAYQERERRWRLHDETRRRHEQERQSETLRRRRLRVLAARWIQHQRASQFVAGVAQRVQAVRLDDSAHERVAQWLEWATNRLRDADPIDVVLKDTWPPAPMPPPMPMPWDWQ